MAILHLLQHHPKGDNLAKCLHRCGADDAIVLLEDAVYALLDSADNNHQWDQLLVETPVYILQAHLQARGLQRLQLRNHTIVDMAGLVTLTAAYTSNISW
jgi:sulfur relay protein TusB/DsrH